MRTLVEKLPVSEFILGRLSTFVPIFRGKLFDLTILEKFYDNYILTDTLSIGISYEYKTRIRYSYDYKMIVSITMGISSNIRFESNFESDFDDHYDFDDDYDYDYEFELDNISDHYINDEIDRENCVPDKYAILTRKNKKHFSFEYFLNESDYEKYEAYRGFDENVESTTINLLKTTTNSPVFNKTRKSFDFDRYSRIEHRTISEVYDNTSWKQYRKYQARSHNSKYLNKELY